MIQIAERAGVEPSKILLRTGLAPSGELVLRSDLARTQKAHWLPVERVFAVWDCAGEWLRGSNLLGDVVASLRPEGLGTLGFRMLTALTLDEAMSHLVQGFELVTNSGRWERRDAAATVTFVWHRLAVSVGQCLSNEAIFGHVIHLLADIGGLGVRPTTVAFQHSQQWTRRSLDVLLGAPIVYGARENALTLPREVLQARPRLANRALGLYFQAQVQDRLDLVRTNPGVVEALRQELRGGLRLSDESLREASARLGLSSRTLQRRLERASTSFSEELTRARRERAFQLVTSTRRPLSEIAAELGFADASVFSRAFRRWFAEQPSVLRRQHTR